MSATDTAALYWSREAGEVCASLGSGPNGLTAARASERLGIVGPNSVEDAERLDLLRLLWRQVGSPLVLILMFAAAVSLTLSESVDAGIILAIVIGSSLLGFYQGVPRLGRGRGTEETPGAGLSRLPRRRRKHGARRHARTGRRPHALGRQPDSRGRTDPRGERLPRQRGEHDRRVVPGGKAARDRRRRCAARPADKRRVPRGLSAQRHGEGGRRRDRPPHRVRRDCRAATGAGSRNQLRPRAPALRLPADPGDDRHRPLRADGEPAAPPSAHRIAALLLVRPRRRALAGAAAWLL